MIYHTTSFSCQGAMTFLKNTDEGSKCWLGNMSGIISVPLVWQHLHITRAFGIYTVSKRTSKPKPQQSAITFPQQERKNEKKRKKRKNRTQCAPSSGCKQGFMGLFVK